MINICQMVHSGMHKCTKKISVLAIDEKAISEDGNANPKVPDLCSLLISGSYLFFYDNEVIKHIR